MYPFERFTENAKKVLTLAQKEAERSHHSYIGTEHLLLGILGLGTGSGYDALVELGIRIDVVRETINSVIGRNERIIIQQIIPTSRVKTVIEMAFEEARRMGNEFVDSGHLLVGLVLEGQGIAAHVLADLGADASSVVATVERLMGQAPSGRGKETRVVGDMYRLMTHRRIVDFMRDKDAAGVQDLVARLAHPPDAVVELRKRIELLREQQQDLRRQLEQAEDEWLREITE